MGNGELVIVFRPKNLAAYYAHNQPEMKFLDNVKSQYGGKYFPRQWTLFPILGQSPKKEGWVKYAGVLYTRERDDLLNPLTKLGGETVVEGFCNMKDIGAVVEARWFDGKAIVNEPSPVQYRDFLEVGLLTKFEDFGLKRPGAVMRFIFDLDSESYEKHAKPYLAEKGFDRIQVKEVK